jgi:branched-chain amino acid transport system substrate-binding protein
MKIELILEDNAGDTAKAVNAFNKLARIDKVPCVISAVSKVIMGTAPIANRNQVVILNVAGVSPEMVKAGPYVFHVVPNLTAEIKALARYVKTSMPQVKTLATFVINDVFGLGSRDAVISEFGALGIKIVGGEFMEYNATTFKSQLTKLKAMEPDAIYMAHYGKEEIILAFKQAKELGINTQWLGFAGMTATGVWEESNGGNEGTIFTQPLFDTESNNPITQAFIARYKKNIGKIPEVNAAMGYDAILVFKGAIDQINKEKKAVTGENIREALLKIRKFNTSTGDLIFQDNGGCSKPIAIRKVVKGKFETIVTLAPE